MATICACEYLCDAPRRGVTYRPCAMFSGMHCDYAGSRCPHLALKGKSEYTIELTCNCGFRMAFNNPPSLGLFQTLGKTCPKCSTSNFDNKITAVKSK